MHSYCISPENCECACHVVNRGERTKTRPHSYPRQDWEHKKPSGWHEALRLGKLFPKMTSHQKQLFGIKDRMSKDERDTHEMLSGDRGVVRLR